MEENTNNNLNFKSNLNKKLKKWLKFIVLGVAIIFVSSLVLNKFFWESILMNIRTKLFLYNIEKQELKYKEDKYGGKTPEETYAMFLSALKKKDIELASKYFVLDKQERYKKALSEVDKNGKWDLMMNDLLQSNLKWRKDGKISATLEIFNNNNEFLTQIDFSLPTRSLENFVPISSFWKISSF